MYRVPVQLPMGLGKSSGTLLHFQLVHPVALRSSFPGTHPSHPSLSKLGTISPQLEKLGVSFQSEVPSKRQAQQRSSLSQTLCSRKSLIPSSKYPNRQMLQIVQFKDLPEELGCLLFFFIIFFSLSIYSTVGEVISVKTNKQTKKLK